MNIDIISLFGLYNMGFQIVMALAITMFVMRSLKSERQKRRINSAEFIQRWNSEKILSTEMVSLTMPHVFSESMEKLDVSYVNSVLPIINFFDEMALSIENNVSDEIMLHKYFKQNLTDYYKKTEEIIEYIRNQRKNDNLYRSFEKLYGKWSFNLMLSENKRVDNG